MSSPEEIVILGTGGNSVDILDTINDINAANKRPRYECLGFLDDDESHHGEVIHGIEILGPLGLAGALPDDISFVSGIGSPSNYARKGKIIQTIGVDPKERFRTIVHPTASVSETSELGSGTVVFQNATVTTDVRIGDHVTVLPNTVISHEDTIGDYTTIAGGVCVSGNVDIGESCYLGTNSAIRGHISIGDRSLIGMGSVVVDDVSPDATVAGTPAKPIEDVEGDRTKR